MPSNLAEDVIIGTGINNSAVASNGSIIGGNSTDRALMAYLIDSKVVNSIAKEEARNFNAFDSAKKFSSVTVQRDGKSMTYIKGAPERIIERCTHYIDENGETKELVEKNYLIAHMDAQAGRSMRLLAVAKREGESDEGDLTLVCVISIRDNVRKEAADAIHEVQNAGIQVVMVTGDRKETAVAIAKEAACESGRCRSDFCGDGREERRGDEEDSSASESCRKSTSDGQEPSRETGTGARGGSRNDRRRCQRFPGSEKSGCWICNGKRYRGCKGGGRHHDSRR